ncbi:MAG: hypothetical protein JNK02_00460, partial [Planctomycetes bacterium]|nr:hypothetical protein [Planctomycetota bacterium]
MTATLTTRAERARTPNFAAILKASERVTWTPEDLIGPGQDFDFSKPFMPEGLARCAELDFLSA